MLMFGKIAGSKGPGCPIVGVGTGFVSLVGG